MASALRWSLFLKIYVVCSKFNKGNMKINEVPQDNESFKEKSKLHKLIYATKEDGSYTSVNSEGWEVENMATRQAWEAVLEELHEVERKVKQGTLSPIAFFMHKNLMDISVLARYVGKWQWQVRRHLKPEVFKKMSQKTLGKYSKAFDIPVKTLLDFGK